MAYVPKVPWARLNRCALLETVGTVNALSNAVCAKTHYVCFKILKTLRDSTTHRRFGPQAGTRERLLFESYSYPLVAQKDGKFPTRSGALPDRRDQVRNWVDFTKAVIGGAGPISPFVHCQNYESTVHFRLQLSWNPEE